MSVTAEKRIILAILLGLIIISSSHSWGQIPSNPPEEHNEAHKWPDHIPGSGFLIKSGEYGQFRISLYGSVRYLNHIDLDETYEFADGSTTNIDQRNDLQFQKALVYFKGWLLTQDFRYLFYVWTSNTSQGLGAQLVLAGNFQYRINKHLDVGAGIGGLPATRSLIGNWPHWLRQDARPMAEEFFRPSYTSGIWVQGEIIPHVYYKTMLGNNLSQLGVNAGQLDNGFDTFSGNIYWVSDGFDRLLRFGDFNRSENLEFTAGIGFTRSNETPQSQPGTEDPENTQIRLSDGRGVFSPGALAEDQRVVEAKYEMLSMNGGVKYLGLSVDLEYYFRWVSKLETNQGTTLENLFDNGFTLKGSYMLIDKKLMLYSYYSKIYGEYGDPWEFGIGTNYYPLKDKHLRFNLDVIFVENSPVGYLSYPTVVGANGTVLMLNMEFLF